MWPEVQSLVRKLRSQKMPSAAKKKKKFLIKITEMKGKENFRSFMRKAVSKIQRNLHKGIS